MWDPNKKVIFIHIAKTGGSSITYYYTKQAFPELKYEDNEDYMYKNYVMKHFMEKLNQNPHAYLSQYEGFLNLDDYYKFSVIREPADYCHSNFFEFPKAYNNKSYVDFVTSGKFKEQIFPQIPHLYNQEGKIQMDKIFKFEKLNQVFKFIDELFDLPPLPNQHSQINYKKIKDEVNNTQELRDIVNNHFYEDYELWKSV